MHRSIARDKLFKMQRAILVLSKNASLIELIRSNLEEGGRYYVQGVTSVHSALAMIRHRSFDLAILDLEQSEIPITPLVHNLKVIQPGIKILVYDHHDPSSNESLLTISVDGFIARPFFAPELSDRLKNLFTPTGAVQQEHPLTEIDASSSEAPLSNAELDLEELSSLLQRTRATAAMSFVHGLPAFKTSSMSPIAAQKITEMIASFWRDYKDCVFCRFLHAEEGMDASLVYAMPITPEVTLAFTYPEGFDLRAIRQETANLRDIFIIGRYANQNAAENISSSLPVEDHEFQHVAASFSDDLDLGIPSRKGNNESHWVLELDETTDKPLSPELDEILLSQPAAGMDTRIDQSLSDTRPIRIQTALFSEDASVLAAGLSPEAPLPDLSSVIEENVHEFQEEPSPHLPADTTLKLPWEETAPAVPNPPAVNVPAEDVLSSTLAAQEALLRELPTPRRSSTFYHCVIVPNSPHYFLTREMGEQSASLIRRHHQMNGWQLLRLTIRPQYALWTVNLPVSIDPVKVVEEIKAETSELLLSAHSDEMQTQEGQSFWAAGYWILSGQHPPSGNLIRQFLKFNDRKSAEESGAAN